MGGIANIVHWSIPEALNRGLFAEVRAKVTIMVKTDTQDGSHGLLHMRLPKLTVFAWLVSTYHLDEIMTHPQAGDRQVSGGECIAFLMSGQGTHSKHPQD
jgi:hypothetical protein